MTAGYALLLEYTVQDKYTPSQVDSPTYKTLTANHFTVHILQLETHLFVVL